MNMKTMIKLIKNLYFGVLSWKCLDNFAINKIGEILKDKAGDFAGDLAGKLLTEIGEEDELQNVKGIVKDFIFVIYLKEIRKMEMIKKIKLG